jgi:hypothetical protein
LNNGAATLQEVVKKGERFVDGFWNLSLGSNGEMLKI